MCGGGCQNVPPLSPAPFHKEVGQVMGMGDQRFTIHTAGTGTRRAAIATDRQSSTGVWLLWVGNRDFLMFT